MKKHLLLFIIIINGIISFSQTDSIYTITDSLPKYKYGDYEFFKFIASNIKYPMEAKENGIQGKVYVQFVVETNGAISNCVVKKDIGGGTGREAVRIINATSGDWISGMNKNVKVRTLLVLPISFKIGNYNKETNKVVYDENKKSDKIIYDANPLDTIPDYYNIGVRQFNDGKIQSAIDYFNKAIKANPKDKDAFYNKGIAEQKIGDLINACKDWKSAADLGDESARKLIEQYCK